MHRSAPAYLISKILIKVHHIDTLRDLNFYLFSTIQDFLIDVLKSIFGELLVFGSYKGTSKKYQIYQ